MLHGILSFLIRRFIMFLPKLYWNSPYRCSGCNFFPLLIKQKCTYVKIDPANFKQHQMFFHYWCLKGCKSRKKQNLIFTFAKPEKSLGKRKRRFTYGGK